MELKISHIIAFFAVIIVLVGVNIYQYRNPRVVEVPTEQTAIDSTAWVKRSAYATRSMILDSLKQQNKALANRIRKSRDQIANYTTITGRLRLQVDSLQKPRPVRMDSIFIPAGAAPDLNVMDTTLVFRQTFTGGLFRVTSRVQFAWPYLDNSLELQQLRDIRISVVNTMNRDRSRMLTYVTSPDFADLEYQTFTEFKRQKRLPWFWIGLGAGVVGTAIMLN